MRLHGTGFFIALFSLVLQVAATPMAAAAELQAPSGQVLLEVRGELTRYQRPGVAQLDLAMLDALPQTTYRVETPWTEGETSFTGVLGSTLFDYLGARPTNVLATALNAYTATLDVSAFTRDGALLATRMNGQPMRIRDKGPVWIIFPWGERPELRIDDVYGLSVWQLKKLELH